MIRLFLSTLVIVSLPFMAGIPNVDDLPINHIQVIGSHNSYKQSIDPVLFKFIKQKDSVGSKKIDYSHISLSQQLDLGLRDLEIDIYADTKGGKYAHPKGLAWAPGQEPFDKDGVMNEPGFKVLHIQDIDFRSNCLTFKQCLQELRQWSDKHKDHDVVFVTMNAKDERMKKPYYTVPEKFTSAIFDQLDQELVENLGRENLIVPDDVRGKYKTLQNAVLHGNWPKVKQAKGKFIFVLDEVGKKRAAYIASHPSLKNRILFTDSEPGTPESAIHIMNNPKKDLYKIQALVKKGYIIRTRADSDTEEARDNDKSTFEAAIASDAQIITTDYYQKSTHFKSDYVVSFADGTYFRPNPLFK
jgi:hypothetical protein